MLATTMIIYYNRQLPFYPFRFHHPPPPLPSHPSMQTAVALIPVYPMYGGGEEGETRNPSPPLAEETPMERTIREIRQGRVSRGKGIFKETFSTETASKLIRALEDPGCRLLYLDLSDGIIQSKSVLEVFIRYAKKLPPVLDLSGSCAMTDFVVPEMCRMLKRCGVRSLVLRRCKYLTMLGVQFFFQLSTQYHLRLLDLSGSGIRGITYPSKCGDSNIQCLNLSGNVFGEKALSEFSDALMDRKFPALNSLFLERCGISGRYGVEFVAALAGMELVHLGLGGNQMNSHTITTLLGLVRVEHFSFRGIKVTKNSLKDILHSLRSSNRSHVLKTLDFSNTRLKSRDMMDMKCSFQALSGIREINFSGNFGDGFETKRVRSMLLDCGIIMG